MDFLGFSTANVNKTTGIRYGVLQGNSFPTLLEEIFSNGDDETFAAHKADLVKQLSRELQDDPYWQRESVADTLAAGVVDEMEWDNYQTDESNYSYTDSEGNEFLLGWLGGATLIWVVKSDRVVHVRSLCSPCVPNAGDLDSGEDDDATDGPTCYGIPSSWLQAFTQDNAEVGAED